MGNKPPSSNQFADDTSDHAHSDHPPSPAEKNAYPKPPPSPSARWREKGNSVYKRALDSHLRADFRADRLRQALQFYEKALSDAHTHEERLAALKNRAGAHMQLYSLTFHVPALRYHLKAACESYGTVRAEYQLGGAKSEQWLQHIITASVASLDSASQFTVDEAASSGHDWRWRRNMLEGFADQFSAELQAYGQLGVAKVMMQAAFALESVFQAAGEGGDENEPEHAGSDEWPYELHKELKYLMEEVHTPLEKARYALSTSPNAPPSCSALRAQIRCDIAQVEEDRLRFLGRATARQAMAIGDRLVSVTGNEEELPVELLWESVDWYHAGMSSAQEVNDTECEAICASKLGLVFQKWLRDETRAESYFTHVIRLTGDLTLNIGMDFHAKAWYIAAREAKEAYQKKRWDQEQARKSADRVAAREEVKAELEALDKCMDPDASQAAQALSLLRHIYAEHPPKTEKWRTEGAGILAELEKENEVTKEKNLYDKKKRQKALVKASLHYHPDKNKDQGLPHLVLCEDIQKLINRCNDAAKGLD